MSLGALCVAALGVLIVISCFTKLNVGVLGIAMAWIIGVYIAEMPANTVMRLPTALF